MSEIKFEIRIFSLELQLNRPRTRFLLKSNYKDNSKYYILNKKPLFDFDFVFYIFYD